MRAADDEVVHFQGKRPNQLNGVLVVMKCPRLFQCVVGGMEFQPTIAVDEKKDAKANAAWKVLQELGFLKPDPSNPL